MSELPPQERREQPNRLQEILVSKKDEFISEEIRASAEMPDYVRALSRPLVREGFKLLIIDGSIRPMETMFDTFGTYGDESYIIDFPEAHLDERYGYRPLLYAYISELNQQTLFVEEIEVNEEIRGQDIATTFYEKLGALASSQGYRFIVGQQRNIELVRFFLRRNRFLLQEVRSELQEAFTQAREHIGDEDFYCTIAFLDPADIERYVRPEIRNLSVTERLLRVPPLEG